MTRDQERKLTRAREFGAKKYGRDYVNIGDHHYRLNVVRTPSLMLDYKLGIGGFPYGHAVEVYGANRIGKSSAVGYGTLGNVQRDGHVPGLIATEPRMVTPEDKEWGLRLGFDPDLCAIQYPDNATEAFDMLRDWVFGDLVDYIMIDSLGGMGTATGATQDGRKKAYGISGEVTAGLNDIMPRLYKNNIGLLIINQQRQGVSATPGMKFYESPGGEALHHHVRVQIHVKPGKNKYTANIDGETVMVGRELTCQMRKNNLSQGQEKTAKFDFFHIETEQYGFGVDTTQDVINVGMLTGVVRKEGQANFYHDSFPKGKLFGKPKVSEFLKGNTEAYEQIRQGVMEVMVKQELADAKQKQDAEQTAQVTKEQAE